MKKRVLKPIKNSVVCEKMNDTVETVSESSLYLKMNRVPFFKIVDFSVDDKDSFPFKVGDIVMSTSTGDEIEINDGHVIYLFKTEHIMCKVCDEIQL